jgi:hypothetical protein
MLGWVKCHVFGVHNYSVCCGRRRVQLECDRCGRRSTGWSVQPSPQDADPEPLPARRRGPLGAASLVALVEVLRLRG